MARKRDRRRGDDKSVGSSGDASRESSRSGDESSGNATGCGFSKIAIILIIPAISLVVYRVLHSSPASVNQDQPYRHRRSLVDTNTSYRKILSEHMKISENVSLRNFTNPVLGYITPWNSQGYEMAKKFVNKFTHLSPVWYELKSEGTSFTLEGRHNADNSWMEDIRSTRHVKILPRVVLEATPLDLLRKKKQRVKAINLIVAECLEMKYDGIVLESWSRWAAYGVLHDPKMRIMALEFIRQLGDAFHSINMDSSKSSSLELIYVISPPSTKLLEYDFGPQDLKSLGDYVDGFSLMTYDFSSPHNPGPNAPLKWIKSSLMLLLGNNNDHHSKLARKIFVGINFYGNDFVASGGLGGGAIVGGEYLGLLEKHKPEMHWEEKSSEHFFLYMDDEQKQHVVFYPTLISIALRMEEALSWGAGISIWEIGQGLQYFFYLF